MPGFGKGTDHFGLASASLVLIDSSSTPPGVSVEHAQDQDGNIAGQGDYESGPATAIECKYRLISSTLNINTIKLGYFLVGTGPGVKTVRTGLDVATSNGEWPEITVSGFSGVTNETEFPFFTPDSITLAAKKQAQGLDFSVHADCRLTSSNYKISGDLAHTLDDDGDVAAMAFTGCTAEISGDAVEVDGIVAWTPGGTWTETQAPGAANSNIGWGTSSFSATKFVAKDEA